MGKVRKLGNDKRLHILISSKDYEALELMAQADSTTVSEIVRRHIRTLTSKAQVEVEAVA